MQRSAVVCSAAAIATAIKIDIGGDVMTQQPIRSAGNLEPLSKWLKVLNFGSRDGVDAFAVTWSSPIAVMVAGDVFHDSAGEALPALLDIIEQLAARPEYTDAQTLVLDIWTPPEGQRGTATGPGWHDEHRRFLQALFARWENRHIVVLTGETRTWDDGMIVRQPYAPEVLSEMVDVIVETSVPFNDYVVPMTWGRCHRHRRIPRAAGLITRWDAELVLGLRPLPDDAMNKPRGADSRQ